MSDERPRCPFCGGKPTVFVVASFVTPTERVKATRYFIECETCGGRGPEVKMAAEAWAGWERRTP